MKGSQNDEKQLRARYVGYLAAQEPATGDALLRAFDLEPHFRAYVAATIDRLVAPSRTLAGVELPRGRR